MLMVLCLMWLGMLSVLALLAALAPAMLVSPVWLPLGMVLHRVLTRWGQPVLAVRIIYRVSLCTPVGPLGQHAPQPATHRGQHQMLPHLRHQSPGQLPVGALTRAPAREAELCRRLRGAFR